MSNEQQPLLSELIREHISITKDEVPVLIEFMHYAQHMERQLGFGRLASDMSRSIRSKDAKLIQTLVDALDDVNNRACWTPDVQDALVDADEAGFKPTK